MEAKMKKYLKVTLSRILIAFLLLCTAMVPASCGSRKAQVHKESTEIKDMQTESSKGNVSKISSSSESEKSINQNDITVKQQEQRITELFNENGGLTKRITELLNTESIDKSVKTIEVVKWRYLYTDSNFNNLRTITKTITVTIKDKKTEAKNDQLYWLLFGLGFLIIIVCGIYRYLTRNKLKAIV